jgi:hypothetical protein
MRGGDDEFAYITDLAEGWYTIGQTYIPRPGVVYSLSIDIGTDFGLGFIEGRITDERGNGIEGMIVEQVTGLMEGGADFILFETQPSRKALKQCARAMRRQPEVPYVLSFAVTGENQSASGESVSRLMAPLPDGAPQPIAWGMNCGTGPDGLLGAVEQVRLARERGLPGAGGFAFSQGSRSAEIAAALKAKVYQEPAPVPTCPWLEKPAEQPCVTPKSE